MATELTALWCSGFATNGSRVEGFGIFRGNLIHYFTKCSAICEYLYVPEDPVKFGFCASRDWVYLVYYFVQAGIKYT